MKKKYVISIDIVLVTLLLCASLLTRGQSKKIRLVTREVSLGKLHPGFVENTLAVSPDGKRLAYVVKQGGKEFVVVDGVQGKEYDEVEKS